MVQRRSSVTAPRCWWSPWVEATDCIWLRALLRPLCRCYTHGVPESVAMDFVLFASAVAPKGLPVILPALAGAGILIFLSQLFVPKT